MRRDDQVAQKNDRIGTVGAGTDAIGIGRQDFADDDIAPTDDRHHRWNTATPPPDEENILETHPPG